MDHAPTPAELAAQLAALADRQARSEARIRELSADNARLRSALEADAVRSAVPQRSAGPAEVVGRRDLLRHGLAAAGAVAAATAGVVLVQPEAAAAATGDPVTLGSTANAADATTAIAHRPGGSAGFAVFDTQSTAIAGTPAIYAQASGAAHASGMLVDASGADAGVRVLSGGEGIIVSAGIGSPLPPGESGGAVGVSVTSTGQGVVASAEDIGLWGASARSIGVLGSGHRAVVGLGTGGGSVGVEGMGAATGAIGRSADGSGVMGEGAVGGRFFGARANLALASAEAYARQAPTGDTVAHRRGDLVEDAAGDLWLCVGDGTPGSWRKLAGPATAGALHMLATPVRAYDSRPGLSPATGPKTRLGGATSRMLDLTRNATGLPPGALAAMVAIHLVNAAVGSGSLTMWANGAPRPSTTTMVWGGSSGRASSSAVTALDALGRCQVHATLATDLVVDVVGYYR